MIVFTRVHDYVFSTRNMVIDGLRPGCAHIVPTPSSRPSSNPCTQSTSMDRVSHYPRASIQLDRLTKEMNLEFEAWVVWTLT